MNPEDEQLLNLLYSINTNLQRCLQFLQSVDVEKPVDTRPKTEDWSQQATQAVQWYNEIQDSLRNVRPMVARRIGQRPSQWTPEDMINLLVNSDKSHT